MRFAALVVFTLLVLPAWAGQLNTVQIFPYVGGSDYPSSCAANSQGASYASVSVTCVMPSDGPVWSKGDWYSGFATAATGIGPLGIGVFSSAAVTDGNWFFIYGYAEADSSWSNQVTPEAGVDAGFIQFHFFDSATFNGTVLGSFDGIQVCSWEFCNSSMIPITFGTPYLLSLASSEVYFSEGEGAPDELYLESVSFFDAAGNPIDGSLLVEGAAGNPIAGVDTPEPASWLLLLVFAAYSLKAFRRFRQT